MSEKIEIIKHKGNLFMTATFNCEYCSHPLTKTFNLDSMFGVIECSHCGRTTPNTCILTTDINERIMKHAIC